MNQKKSSKISLADVARKAGVSTVAASYALRNSPGVSKETRAKVLRLARKMGYAPDPRVNSWMARMRDTKNKELLPLVWLNHHRADADAWHRHLFLSPYLEGAKERALELGYSLEEIWTRQAGMTSRRLSQILYHRGIEGVIVTNFAKTLELDWDHLAAVSLGTLESPGLPRIQADHLYNFQTALEEVKQAGYRRIGVCFTEDFDTSTAQSVRAAAFYHNAMIPHHERVEPLFYPWGGKRMEAAGAARVVQWLKKEKPEVVIGLSNLLIEWAAEAGMKVPKDVAVVHIANDDDVKEWAGVCSNKRAIGAAAINMIVANIQNRQFGIPSVASRTLIRGTWTQGFTLPLRKARRLRG